MKYIFLIIFSFAILNSFISCEHTDEMNNILYDEINQTINLNLKNTSNIFTVPTVLEQLLRNDWVNIESERERRHGNNLQIDYNSQTSENEIQPNPNLRDDDIIMTEFDPTSFVDLLNDLDMQFIDQILSLSDD